MNKNYNTSQTLIERLIQQEGTDRNWHDFVDHYKNFIYAIIQQFNLPYEISDDLFQKVLVQVWKDIPKFNYNPKISRFRCWLGVVTRNCIKMHIRSKAFQNEKKTRQVDETLEALSGFSEPEIEKIAEQEWRIYIAEKAYKNLANSFSDNIKAVISMDMKNADDKSISNELGIALSSVRVYRKRGRNALLKEMARLNTELDIEKQP